MTDYTLLNALKAVVTVVDPTARVIYPNEPNVALESVGDAFYEVFVTGRELARETETAFVSTAVGSIVVTGEQNTGVARLDDLAEEIVWLFSPCNPSVYNWFSEETTTTTGSDDDSGGNVERRKAQVYITSVKRSETGVYNNRFKITIFVTFEIYEGKVEQ